MPNDDDVRRAYEQTRAEIEKADRDGIQITQAAVAAMLTAALAANDDSDTPDPDAITAAAAAVWSTRRDRIAEWIGRVVRAGIINRLRRLPRPDGDPGLRTVSRATRRRVAEIAADYVRTVHNRLDEVPQQVWDDVSRALAAGIESGDTPRELRARVATELDIGEWSYRAERIARTETTGAFGAAQSESLDLAERELGEPLRRMWLAKMGTGGGPARDVRPEHQAAHRQIVESGTPFNVGGTPMRFPGDPSAPPALTVNCRCTVVAVAGDLVLGLTDDAIQQEREAMQQKYEGLAADDGGNTVTAGCACSTLESEAAAADDALDDARRGAMVALIPTEDDAARLAVEGGVPADELHVTLWFLGEGAERGDADRQRVRDAAATIAASTTRVEARAFAAAAFNPDTDSPCVVYLVGDDSEVLETIRDAVGNSALAEMEIPTQHSPWQPHITIAYGTTDTSVLRETGPVVFDRIRVAFAGEYTDFVLGEPSEAPTVALPEEGVQIMETVTATVVGDTDLPIAGRDRDWDGDKARSRVLEWATNSNGDIDPEKLARAFLYRDPEANPDTVSAYKMGFADIVDGELRIVARGVFAAAGRLGQVDVPEEEREQIRSQLTVLYEKLADAFDDPEIVPPWEQSTATTAASDTDSDTGPRLIDVDELIRKLRGESFDLDFPEDLADALEALTASAALDNASIVAEAVANAPETPSRAVFEPRELRGPTPITVTAASEVYGHLAPWNVPHAGIRDENVYAPKSRIAYDLFHNRDVVTAEGDTVRAGVLLVGCDHAPDDMDVADARDYHDQVCTPAAVVRAYEDEHGIAVTGTLLPGLTVDQVAQLRKLSGEWRTAQLELMAAVGVERAGFPVPGAREDTVAVAASAERGAVSLTAAMLAHIPRKPIRADGTLDEQALAVAVADELEAREAERERVRRWERTTAMVAAAKQNVVRRRIDEYRKARQARGN